MEELKVFDIVKHFKYETLTEEQKKSRSVYLPYCIVGYRTYGNRRTSGHLQSFV